MQGKLSQMGLRFFTQVEKITNICKELEYSLIKIR